MGDQRADEGRVRSAIAGSCASCQAGSVTRSHVALRLHIAVWECVSMRPLQVPLLPVLSCLL